MFRRLSFPSQLHSTATQGFGLEADTGKRPLGNNFNLGEDKIRKETEKPFNARSSLHFFFPREGCKATRETKKKIKAGQGLLRGTLPCAAYKTQGWRAKAPHRAQLSQRLASNLQQQIIGPGSQLQPLPSPRSTKSGLAREALVGFHPRASHPTARIPPLRQQQGLSSAESRGAKEGAARNLSCIQIPGPQSLRGEYFDICNTQEHHIRLLL